MSYTGSGVGGSIGGGNLDIRERFDSIERGDSFAPATVKFNCGESVTIPPGGSHIFPITFAENFRGKIFEFLFPERVIRVRQAGVIGFTASVAGVATGPGNFTLIMTQNAPPYHDWLLFSMPFRDQPTDFLTYTVGGIQMVDVPEGGANYRVGFYNTAGPGSFTVWHISVSLVYLGLR